MTTRRSQRHARWVTLLCTLALPVVAGCGSPAPPVQQPSVAPLTEANLTALDIIVERQRDGQATIKVQKDDKGVDIQVGDTVSVNDKGRGRLTFPDTLQVDLLGKSEAIVKEVRLAPGNTIFVRMQQTFGHTRTQLEENAHDRVAVETKYATITSLVSGTDFLVCHGEALTCLVAMDGEVAVEAQNTVVTVRKGEATYILPGEPPRPAICANAEEVEHWLEEKQSGKDIDPLGALVKNWPQKPCPIAQLQPSATVTPTLPSPSGMVKVEAGQYSIGRAAADDSHASVQSITLGEFWIDEHEVTYDQYPAFMAATGHVGPAVWPGITNRPVQGASWDDAVAFCTWAGKRLPDEAEWEVAARGPGTDPPLYPWGPDPRAGGLADKLSFTETYEVGTKAFNRSALGVYDMAGNVWEWVGQPYAPVEAGNQILRGGRYGYLKDMAYRQQARPDDPGFVAVAGFRCAANQVAGD